MKKVRWIALFLILIFIISLIVGRNAIKESLKSSSEEKQDQEIEEILNSLTLEEKIGQMLIIYNRTSKMTDELKEDLKTNKPGGFILFKDNFSDYENTLKLIEDIKRTAEIPMFIGIDQEGGKVQRLEYLTDSMVTKIPAMFDVGNTGDISLAEDIGKVIAEELQVFGINMDFAPVIDVLSTEDSEVIGTRSFGNNPKLVANMGISLAKGLEDDGVIAVYKHFPGHGSTSIDSHVDLPIISKTKEELQNSDFIPFLKAIENNAKVIMVGHLSVPLLTGDNTPASLSKTIITDILKEEMGFDGLVVTDALNMQALTKYYSEKEIYEMAINAGVDILLMPSSASSAIALIKESIEEQMITEEQIDVSVRKILKLKYSGLSNETLSKDYLGSKEHQEIVNKVLNY